MAGAAERGNPIDLTNEDSVKRLAVAVARERVTEAELAYLLGCLAISGREADDGKMWDLWHKLCRCVFTDHDAQQEGRR